MGEVIWPQRPVGIENTQFIDTSIVLGRKCSQETAKHHVHYELHLFFVRPVCTNGNLSTMSSVLRF